MTKRRLTNDRRPQFVALCAENGGDWQTAGETLGYAESTAKKMFYEMRQEIARESLNRFGQHLPYAMQRLGDLMRSEDEKIALAAIKDYFDRAGVTPKQVVEIRKSGIEQMTDEELLEMLNRHLVHIQEPYPD